MAKFDLDDAPFKIHVIGNRTKKLYTGDFRALRFLSHRLMMSKDRLRREFLSGPNMDTADQTEQRRAQALAECTVSITKAPQFWKDADSGLDLIDENVLVEVFEAIKKIQEDAVKENEVTDDEKKALQEDAKKKVSSPEEE